jgi:hypothetical protein
MGSESDAAVAGVLGAALLGAAAAAAHVSGSAMGAAVAGALFATAAACWLARLQECRRLAASNAALLAGVLFLQVAGLALGLSRSVFGSKPLLSGPAASLLAGLFLAAGLASRPQLSARRLRIGCASAAAVLGATGGFYATAVAFAGLAAGACMAVEMVSWSVFGRRGGSA